MGVSEATVRRNLRTAGFDRNDVRNYLPEFETAPLDLPIETIGEIGLAADWHLPLCDYAYANKMIGHFVDLGITTLGIPGDFFNMDGLSQYEPKQNSANLEREIHEGQKVMDRLLDVFKRIIFTRGNHDVRLARKLGYSLAFKQSMNMLLPDIDPVKRSRLEVSNLDYFWNRPYEGASDYESWYICHPENYSSLPGSVARDMAGKLGSNVLTAHSHHAAVMYAKNGVHTCAELGGLHDKRVTAYLQSSNKFARWVNGYGWIDANNKFHMESEGFST